jgi:hypothetical protein
MVWVPYGTHILFLYVTLSSDLFPSPQAEQLGYSLSLSLSLSLSRWGLPLSKIITTIKAGLRGFARCAAAQWWQDGGVQPSFPR